MTLRIIVLYHQPELYWQHSGQIGTKTASEIHVRVTELWNASIGLPCISFDGDRDD